MTPMEILEEENKCKVQGTFKPGTQFTVEGFVPDVSIDPELWWLDVRGEREDTVRLRGPAINEEAIARVLGACHSKTTVCQPKVVAQLTADDEHGFLKCTKLELR